MIGLARGGRLDGLFRISLRMVPLLVVGIALVLAGGVPWGVSRLGPALVGAGYLAGLAMLWQNRGRPWIPILLIGAALNAAVILANAGRMPVAASMFERMGRPIPESLVVGSDPRHVLAGPGTALGWLGDRVAVHLGQFGVFLSIGDVVMAVGRAGFVQAALLEGGA